MPKFIHYQQHDQMDYSSWASRYPVAAQARAAAPYRNTTLGAGRQA